MKKNITPFLLSLILVNFSQASFSELLELEDKQLAKYRGQAAANLELQESTSLTQAQTANQASNLLLSAPTALPSAGITMDINLQLHIEEIRWVDSDGVGTNGTQGAIIMKGFSVGSLNNEVLSPASIRGVTLDVDGKSGLVVGVQQIGGPGEGIDVKIDSIQLR